MNTTTNPPGSPQGDVYLPTDISPETLFQAWSRQRREALIELLIDTLDTADGESDLEPSLGYNGPGVDEPWDDREGDAEDDEASLGWTEQEARWGRHTLTDRQLIDCEDEHDGAEPTEDREPSLGSLSSNGGSQSHWGAGGSSDLEEDNDSGVGDLDGLHEQNLVSRQFQQVI